MRWLRPTPVLPAIQAGTHPPLGVMLTTQPSSSAASTEVVPAVNSSINFSSSPFALRFSDAWKLPQFLICSVKGFFLPSNG